MESNLHPADKIDRFLERFDFPEPYEDEIRSWIADITNLEAHYRARIEALERWVRAHDADPDALS